MELEDIQSSGHFYYDDKYEQIEIQRRATMYMGMVESFQEKEDIDKILLYPQWYEKEKRFKRTAENKAKMGYTGSCLEAALTKLVRTHNDYIEVAQTHPCNNQLIIKYYEVYQTMEINIKQFLQSFKETHPHEVSMTQKKLDEWLKTINYNKEPAEKVEHDRKQNWDVFDSLTEMAYTTIEMGEKESYIRGEKRYLYKQYRPEMLGATKRKIIT